MQLETSYCLGEMIEGRSPSQQAFWCAAGLSLAYLTVTPVCVLPWVKLGDLFIAVSARVVTQKFPVAANGKAGLLMLAI